jgi:heme/copper-type cytochrome/quinol oxidase subunit 3
MEASAPVHPRIEPEPPEWQPRALWLGARLLSGAAAFFFISFVFAYFYLRSLNENHAWRIGHHVNPSIGLGVAIVVVLIVSAVLLWMASTRPAASLPLGGGALAFALAAVVLQCIQYAYLGFGPGNGAYASVYIGWTATFTVFMLACIYWIETQVASIWRLRRGEVRRAVEAGVPAPDTVLADAGIRACSFFWSFYVAIGVIAFIILFPVSR